MDKKSIDFSVDSKGFCFLCLRKIPTLSTPIAKLDEKLDNSHSSAYSLQDVSRYLKIDMRKVFIDQGPVPPHLLAKVERARLKVELCEGCGSMTENISKLCRQLEKLKLEIESGLESIHAKMTDADETGNTEQFRKVAVSEFNSGMGGCMEILEVLRMETMQKCFRKLTRPLPRLQIQKLTNSEIKRKTHRILSTVTETSSEWLSEGDFMETGQPNGVNWTLEEDNHSTNSDGNDFKNDVDDSITTTILKVEAEPIQRRRTTSNAVMQIRERALENNLQRKWTIHPETGKYKCELCAKEYASCGGVSLHYSTVHRRIRFKCKICDKEFKERSKYKRHHESVHMGVRFQCQVCNKTFSQMGTLRMHQRKAGCAMNFGIEQKTHKNIWLTL